MRADGGSAWRSSQAGRTRESLEGYIFLLPALAILLVFHIFPALYTLYMSLYRWEVVQEAFVGLRNYAHLLRDRDFGHSLLLSVVYVAGTVPVEMAVGLALAILLYKGLRARGLFRLVYFLPFITSQVALSLVWGWIFNAQYGVANAALRIFHLPPQGWLLPNNGASSLWTVIGGGRLQAADPVPPSLSLAAIMLVTVWFFLGFHTIVYLSGLSAIPGELTEAARMDGASGFKLFRYVTFPLLTPTTYFLLIVATIGALTSFNIVYILGGGGVQAGCGGNPLQTTKVASLFIFDRFWCQTELGYASAAAFLLSLVILALTLVNARAVGRRVAFVE
jgi:multiple sugar transport system permease protein